jgi:hypothetical protein
MGNDDDMDCVEHVFRLIEVVFESAGAVEHYECERCPAVSVRHPGGRAPASGSGSPASLASNVESTDPTS